MNGVNFENLVVPVRPNLEKQDTNLRKAIPKEKRVSVAPWRSDRNSYSSGVI